MMAERGIMWGHTCLTWREAVAQAVTASGQIGTLTKPRVISLRDGRWAVSYRVRPVPMNGPR